MSAEMQVLGPLLPPVGTFIDIGAFDGITDSLSRSLWVRGWGGVMVEPNPTNFARLLELYADTEEVKLVNAPLWPVPGPCEFWSQLPAGQLSSGCPRHIGVFGKSGIKFRQYLTVALTPAQLLVYCPEAINADFLNIDAEGMSLQLLENFPLAIMPRLAAISIEHDQDPDRAARTCALAGFREVCRNEVNLIAARTPPKGGG